MLKDLRAFLLSLLLVLFGTGGTSVGQQKQVIPELEDMGRGKEWKVSNRNVSHVTDGKRKVVRFDEQKGYGLAWLPSSTFSNGVIEFDVKGKNVDQKSFPGVAFHGLNDSTYDAVYFRPFNFKSEDSLRHIHAVQYVSHPNNWWKVLRQLYPGVYENAVQPVPDPDSWFHVRLVLEYPKVSVFVNDAEKPCLVVDQLSDRKTGWVGLWVGDDSDGDFANLTITTSK